MVLFIFTSYSVMQSPVLELDFFVTEFDVVLCDEYSNASRFVSDKFRKESNYSITMLMVLKQQMRAGF
jgi:hypothetical protein